MSKKLLVLAHDASRTGAPVGLLHLLEWLGANTAWKLEVLLGRDGDLHPRFAALAPTEVWDVPAPTRISRRTVSAVRSRLGLGDARRERLLRRLAARRFDGIYANSAATARLLPPLAAQLRAPILFHVHELEYTLRRNVKLGVFRAAQAFVKHYLAASEATRQNLIDHHGVSPADVTRIYESIPARRYRSEAGRDSPRATRESLAIPHDAYVIAAGGTLQWRKGPDLFLQVGRRLADVGRRDFVLLWVGGPTRGEEYERLQYEAGRFGLEDRLRITDYTDSPVAYLATADVFVLTSREEPLSLIALEAGAIERPIVCFEHAGGIPELMSGGRGIVVPYADAGAMAEAVARLWDDRSAAARLGRRFSQHVAAHHDVDVVFPVIRDLIEHYLFS